MSKTVFQKWIDAGAPEPPWSDLKCQLIALIGSEYLRQTRGMNVDPLDLGLLRLTQKWHDDGQVGDFPAYLDAHYTELVTT